MPNSTSHPGPPYPPTHQALGEVPSILPDIPITAVFLTLFAVGGASHMTLFFRNKLKHHKFVFNALIFGFCMSRVTATSIRIAWACHPHNINLGIAASVFVNVGVLILYIVNLFLSLRIVRAQHPRIGWSKPLGQAVYFQVAVMVLTIPCLIASVIVEFYTSTDFPQRSARDVQIYGTTVYAVGSMLPVPMVGISALIRAFTSARTRREKTARDSSIGDSHFNIFLVLLPALFLGFAAWVRAVGTYLAPTPLEGPAPWYLAKATFYLTSFTIEIAVVYTWLLARIDRRFHVPDGQKRKAERKYTKRPISESSIFGLAAEVAPRVGEGDKAEGEVGLGEEEQDEEEHWGAMSPVVGGPQWCGANSGCALCAEAVGRRRVGH